MLLPESDQASLQGSLQSEANAPALPHPLIKMLLMVRIYTQQDLLHRILMCRVKAKRAEPHVEAMGQGEEMVLSCNLKLGVVCHIT